MKHPRFVFQLCMIIIITGIFSALSACSTPILDDEPSPAYQVEPENIEPVPQADSFSGLPFHLIGELVEEGGYSIKVYNIVLEPGTVRVSATLTNKTEHTIDLSNALNLYAPDGMRITAEGVSGMLNPGSSLDREFDYVLPSPFLQDSIMDYRLLYTPFGWSGPVIVFLLVDSLPDVAPPPTPREEDIPKPSTQESGLPRGAYNGITGDPWKVLVLIYPNIDFDYVENGESKNLTASMPVADINAMKTDFLNLPHQNIVYDYSGNTGEMEVHFIEVSRPLTTLAPISNGYWPDQNITRQELNLYAPPGKYDSVIVFWQVSDPNTGQSIPTYGWGLGYWPGDDANGMTYATVFNISWVWPTDQCKGEVFLHEWLHGVTGFYQDHLGFPFNVEDLHGAEEAGYQWDYDQDGCWDMWLRDYMRGLVYENGQRKALVPQTWQSGSITTHHINGWRGEYFDNEILSGIPVLVRDDPAVNFDWQSDAPHPLVPDDHFSVRWTKTIYFNGGNYKFDLFRDDGIRLKIDGMTELEAWYYGREWISKTISLTQGNHTLVVESYEIDGWAAAKLLYTSPSQTQNFSSTGSYDGWILELRETSNTGGTPSVNGTIRIGDDAANKQYRGILSFNTAALPDNANINKVTLKIKKYTSVGTNPFTTHGNLIADIRKGTFGLPALQITDFQATPSKSNVGRFIAISGAPGWYQMEMGTIDSYVNKTGVTQFRLRFGNDDNNDWGADFISFFAGEALPANRPVLSIEYYAP